MQPLPTAPQPEDFVGKEFAGVRVGDLIQRGGMGVVYRGTRTADGAEVAIKFLHTNDMQNPQLKERFFREIQAAASIHHPNVVRVYDGGEQQGMCYITMEYVRGMDLFDYLEKHRRLPETDAVRMFAALLDALELIHQAGLVHRDIKPENILLANNTEPKITDFGLARSVQATTLTAAGMVLGTPLYMAPEQFKTSKVDGRADLYAVGCVMYHAVVGRPPYEGDFLTLARQHREAPPTLPRQLNPDLSPDVEAVILRLMAKKPEFRFSSAAKARRALLGEISAHAQSDRMPATRIIPGEKLRRGALHTRTIIDEHARNTSQRRRESSVVATTAARVPTLVWVLIGVILVAGIGLAAMTALGGGEPDGNTHNTSVTHDPPFLPGHSPATTTANDATSGPALTREQVEARFEALVPEINRVVYDGHIVQTTKEAVLARLVELHTACPDIGWLDELATAAGNRMLNPLALKAPTFAELLGTFGNPIVESRAVQAIEKLRALADHSPLPTVAEYCRDLPDLPACCKSDAFPAYREFRREQAQWYAVITDLQNLVAEAEAAKTASEAASIAARFDRLQVRTRDFNGAGWLASVRRKLAEVMHDRQPAELRGPFVGDYTLVASYDYTISARLRVPADHVLFVMPGTRLRFQGSCDIVANGHLQVAGRAEFPVVMEPAGRADAGWDGIFVDGGSATLRHTTLSGGRGHLVRYANQSFFAGGNLLAVKGTVDLAHCAIQNGEVSVTSSVADLMVDGGGMFLIDSDSTLAHCEFAHNRAPNGRNGALGAFSGRLAISNCRFIENRAREFGGAIGTMNIQLSITDSLFAKNQSDSFGGAIFMQGVTASIISRCEFTGNFARQSGGALCIINCMPAVQENLFANNSAGPQCPRAHRQITLQFESPSDATRRYTSDLNDRNTFGD